MNHTTQQVVTLVDGWVSGPSTRGSKDIIWSSSLTIFLCTWTAVCLNVPHPNDSDFKILLRRVKWMFLGIFTPEFVLAIALGQHLSARHSVQRFHDLGYSHWTLRHSFFVNMGGLLLQPKESAPFLVNSSQLAYLVEKGYMECPAITAEEIWDKSKADLLTKTLAFLQACWLAIQLLGRAILQLPISPLELYAGANVLCTLGTFICWLQKPNDVRKTITLTIDVSTAQITADAGGEAAISSLRSPLDSVEASVTNQAPSIVRFYNLPGDKREQTLDRFFNDTFTELNYSHAIVYLCLGKVYAASHLIAWGFQFPTYVELVIWRVASSVATGSSVLLSIFEILSSSSNSVTSGGALCCIWSKKTPRKEMLTKPEDGNTIGVPAVEDATAVRRGPVNTRSHTVWKGVVRAILALTCAIARVFLVVEAIVSLRALPADVYQTFDIVDVFSYWRSS
ncbi:hypothetical protein F5Y19DRAFT_93874 [Xylariaceae sp. FL1651]|nr:hypothetical protein F5Y19DRAFT_93874 [Xylariaceae sp. FL1651]